MGRVRMVLAGLAISTPVLIASGAHASDPASRAVANPIPTKAQNPAHCDPIGGWRPGDGSHDCLLPFPSNYFSVIDKKSVTNRRVQINGHAMPSDAAGKPISPTSWNRTDGFS